MSSVLIENLANLYSSFMFGEPNQNEMMSWAFSLSFRSLYAN